MLDPLRHRYFLERGSHLRIEIVRAKKELAELQYELSACELVVSGAVKSRESRSPKNGPERAAAARARKKDRGE